MAFSRMKFTFYLMHFTDRALRTHGDCKFAVDFGSSLCWGKPTVLCFRPVTDALQLKIRWAEVQPCFVRVR